MDGTTISDLALGYSRTNSICLDMGL